MGREMLRTKVEQILNMTVLRGVQRHHLFTCLGLLRDIDRQEMNATYGQDWNEDLLAKCWTENQIDGLTFFNEDAPVACVLGWCTSPGHWTCGMVATDDWQVIARPASRYLRRHLAPVLAGNRVRRASCVLAADVNEPLRWLKFLGFELEGRLRRYGVDGQDFLVLSYLPTLPRKRKELKRVQP